MHFLGKVIKRLLRSIFSIIIFLLLIWWAKMNRNLNAYIDFLNSNDRSAFHRSQPATWVDPFWQSKELSGDIADQLTWDGTNPSSSGVDASDFTLDEELSAFSDSGISDTTGEAFWFTSGGQTTSNDQSSSGSDAKSQLLNLIKNKLTK